MPDPLGRRGVLAVDARAAKPRSHGSRRSPRRSPRRAQAGIARAIAAIAGNPAPVANIAGALTSGDITPTAQPQLQQALTLASGAMFTGVGQLAQIVGMLPAPAQGSVNMAITRVTGILSSIFGTGSPSGATTGGMLSNLPIPTNLPIPCGLPIPKFLPFAKSC